MGCRREFSKLAAPQMLAGYHGPARPGKAALLAAEHGCLHIPAVALYMVYNIA